MFRKNKKNKLKNIAKILSGYSFKGSVDKLPPGDTYVIQAKDITKNLSIKLNKDRKISLKDINSQAITQKDDVIVVCKGNPSVGIVSSNAQTLVSSSLYIIRATNDYIIPKFLAIYLNSSKGQKELDKISLGAYIKGISRQNLEELMIPVPSIKTQRLVISLFDNMTKQKDHLERKILINDELLNYTINKLNL